MKKTPKSRRLVLHRETIQVLNNPANLQEARGGLNAAPSALDPCVSSSQPLNDGLWACTGM